MILLVAGSLTIGLLAAAFMIRGIVYQNIIDQKMTTVHILTDSIVHDIKYEYQGGTDYFIIKNIIRKYMTYYRIIKRISYYNYDQTNKADSDPMKVGKKGNELDVQKAVSLARPSTQLSKTDYKTIRIRSTSPILHGSNVIGAIKLEVSIDDIEMLLLTLYKRFYFIMAITVLIVSLIVFFILRYFFLTRINTLMTVTSEISSGNFDIQLETNWKDEIGELSIALNHMALELRKSKFKIDQHQEQLEHKVKEATAQLQLAYDDLKSAQAQMVLSDKMATIGTLIAGIAHEINTPIGAINNVSSKLKKNIQSLPKLITCIQSQNFQTSQFESKLKICLDEIIQSAQKIQPSPSYLEIRQFEQKLKENKHENWDSISTVLCNFNFISDEQYSKYSDLYKDPILFGLIEVVGNIAQSSTISEMSSKKMQKIIRALKYYAYTDSDKIEKIQINESLQTALILLNAKIGDEAKVHTQFDENLPSVPCTNEIHQVWTNLLSNAIDSIQEKGDVGQISIITTMVNENVQISIQDNGVGIPKDIQHKIFDPFFTTKDIGKGTGLGLSIVSGIIKKHDGTIRLEQDSTHTTFLITLPL